MKKLLRYHTIQCNPDYYWENNQVALKLKSGEIKTYEDYEKACKEAGLKVGFHALHLIRST